jgi:hypothetical protein
VEPKDYEVTITVTDNGEPPLSDSQTVLIVMDDDAARFTYLVGCIHRDGHPQAWLYDRLNNRRIVVEEAETLKLAGLEAQVRSIGRDFVLLDFENATWQLDLGEHLRALTKRSTPSSEADSAVPALKPSPRVPYE